jgi:DnaJ-domain-containing protein 1
VVPPRPNIFRHALLAIRKLLASIHSGASRVRNGFAQVRRAAAERRRQAAEQIRKEAEQRQLVAAQREAERARKHRQWLTTLHREMASVPTDGAAMKAVRAFDKLTAMIGSLCQLGPAGFNEGEFNSTICTMWTNLQHQSLETVPTLRDHLVSILKGFTDGWNKIKASWQSSGRQASPVIIATGRNKSEVIGSAIGSYVASSLVNSFFESAERSRQEKERNEGEAQMYKAAREFKQMVDDFNELRLDREPARDNGNPPKYTQGDGTRQQQAKRDRTQEQRATQTSAKSDYEILEVSPNASDEEIDAAYRRSSQMYHPDKVETLAPEYKAIAAAKMKEINAAYARLKSQGRKQ